MDIIVGQVRKSKVESITFNWAESMKLENGTTVKTFKEAQNIIDMLACEYGSNNGYCKTSFTITWEDGRQHEGRIDVQLRDNMETNAIGEHVKAFYERCACLKLFCDTKEEQENYVRSTMKADPSEFIELLEKYHFEDVTEEVEATPELTTEQVDTGITYKLNQDKNGVEIYFVSIPSEETRTQLKSHGFKWSRFSKCWYAKQNENTISLAEQLASGNIQVIEVAEQTETDVIEFIDITQFKISEETEKRLIDNSLFGRRNVGQETESLQGTLFQLMNTTKEVIELTDNTYNKNKLIKGFNDFCIRYTRELNAYLYKNSITVGWHVSGRGNLDINKYNKKQDAITKKMLSVVEMLDKQKSILNKYKRQFKREKDQAIKQGITNAINGLTSIVEFTTRKKEIEYYGYKYNTRSYESNNYFFMKLATCYRIFDKTTGKEIHSLKTADKLTDAKNYVSYLENERLKAVV